METIEDDLTDSDIERMIEEELSRMNLDGETVDNNVDGDGNASVGEDENDTESMEIEDKTLDVSLTNYLSFLQRSESRAKQIITESEEIISNLNNGKSDYDDLLKRKLQEVIHEDGDDVMVLRNQVMHDLFENEEYGKSEERLYSNNILARKNLRNDDVNETGSKDLIDGDEKESIDREKTKGSSCKNSDVLEEIEKIEEKTQLELKHFIVDQALEEEGQRKVEEQRIRETEEIERAIEERRKKNDQEIQRLQEKSNKEQEKIMSRLQEDLAKEEKKIEMAEKQVKEKLDDNVKVEKEKLREMQNEMMRIKSERRISSAVSIQRLYRGHRIRKQYSPQLKELRHQRIKREQEIFKELLRKEGEELKLRQQKLAVEEEKEKMRELKKIEEKQQRLQHYEKLKEKVKEDNLKTKMEEDNPLLTGESDSHQKPQQQYEETEAKGEITKKISSLNQELNNIDLQENISLGNLENINNPAINPSKLEENEAVYFVKQSNIEQNYNENANTQSSSVIQSACDVNEQCIIESNMSYEHITEEGNDSQETVTKNIESEGERLCSKDISVASYLNENKNDKVKVDDVFTNFSHNDSDQKISLVHVSKVEYDIVQKGVIVSESLPKKNYKESLMRKATIEEEVQVTSHKSDLSASDVPDQFRILYNTWLKVALETQKGKEEMRPPFRKKKSSNLKKKDKKKTTIKEIFQFDDSDQSKTIKCLCRFNNSVECLILDGDTFESQFPKLECLILSKCNFSVVEVCLEALHSLTVSDSNVVDIYLNSRNLHILDLRNNDITSLNGFQDCLNLRYLNLSQNKIRRLTGIEGCQQLQYLNVDGNEIVSTKGIKYMRELSILSCALNDITSLEELPHCTKLVKLNVENNNLTKVPNLSNNVLLCQLFADHNSINSAMSLLHYWLPLLCQVSFNNNSLTEIPNPKQLISLQTFECANNLFSDTSLKENRMSQPHDKDSPFVQMCKSQSNTLMEGIKSIENEIPDITCKLEDEKILDFSNRKIKALEDFGKLCSDLLKTQMSFCKDNQLTIEITSALEENEDTSKDSNIQKNDSNKASDSATTNGTPYQKECNLRTSGTEKKKDCLNDTKNKRMEFSRMNKILNIEENSSEQTNIVSRPAIQAIESSSFDITGDRRKMNKLEGKSKAIDPEKRNKAAVKIQANYRRHRIRTAYLNFLHRLSEDGSSDYDEVDLSDFNFDDNAINDWKPNDAPQHIERTSSLSDQDGEEQHVIANRKIIHAWETPDQSRREEFEDLSIRTESTRDTPTTLSETGTYDVDSTNTGNVDQTLKSENIKEDVYNEWGFLSARTKEMMKKRAKKLGVGRKKKISDPQKRYELMKKKDQLRAQQVMSSRQKPIGEKSNYQRLTLPNVQLGNEENPDNEEMVYRWVCHQAVLHKDQVKDEEISPEAKNNTSNRKSDFYLPALSPSVLAGKPTSLIQSEIHNPKPDVRIERRNRSRKNKNKYEQRDEDKPSTRSSSTPTHRSIEKKNMADVWKELAYR